MNPLQKRCLILGASTRAAAQSALYAGYHPVCADLFADTDLCTIAERLPLQNYPDNLVEQATSISPISWMYTGALENSPEIIQAISKHHVLWGNNAEVVQAVRNPQKLYQVLKKHDLTALHLREFNHPPPANSRWMLKPKRSAGGREVTVWNREAESYYAESHNKDKLSTDYYFQQRAEGKNYSALYLASATQTVLIGLSAQLVGCHWLNADNFTWCGNVAPVLFSHQPEKHQKLAIQAEKAGNVIAKEFGLRGLFGIDFILETPFLPSSFPQLFPLEVNPRYVASVELFERAFDVSLLKWHIAACESFEQSQQEEFVTTENYSANFSAKAIQGKAILYANCTFTFPLTIERMPNCADIPSYGRLIQKNEPICTVFATGKTIESCQKDLQERSDEIYDALKIKE
ncbi:hypothetical protein MNBD_PLANCTO02-3177 [hydrothermal vent metagenome]|uniref:ATP-grasp domain-containing protein n=1 Tax=hydrothermal vent metagenome TaxID=652676 RepID=A0A3B1D9W9_9ZZZZ